MCPVSQFGSSSRGSAPAGTRHATSTPRSNGLSRTPCPVARLRRTRRDGGAPEPVGACAASGAGRPARQRSGASCPGFRVHHQHLSGCADRCHHRVEPLDRLASVASSSCVGIITDVSMLTVPALARVPNARRESAHRPQATLPASRPRGRGASSRALATSPRLRTRTVFPAPRACRRRGRSGGLPRRGLRESQSSISTQQATAAPATAVTHLCSLRCACHALAMPVAKLSTTYSRRHSVASKSLAKCTLPRSSIAEPPGSASARCSSADGRVMVGLSSHPVGVADLASHRNRLWLEVGPKRLEVRERREAEILDASRIDQR